MYQRQDGLGVGRTDGVSLSLSNVPETVKLLVDQHLLGGNCVETSRVSWESEFALGSTKLLTGYQEENLGLKCLWGVIEIKRGDGENNRSYQYFFRKIDRLC